MHVFPDVLSTSLYQGGEDPDDLSEVSLDEDDGHDSGIELVLTPGSSRLSLRAQHTRVKRVASRAIDELLADVCLVNAFPDGPEKSSDFGKRALIKSAKACGYTTIVQRLQKDKRYCLKLSSIVSTSSIFVELY